MVMQLGSINGYKNIFCVDVELVRQSEESVCSNNTLILYSDRKWGETEIQNNNNAPLYVR